jgi:hypothetical protein
MMILPLLISFISANSTTCNSFPKIYGGSSGDTFLIHFDVFNDYLAIGGYNLDY